MRQYNMTMVYALPSVANPTPVPFAIGSDAKVGFKQEKKYLQGQMETAFDAGGGKVDSTIEIGNMDFRANILAMLLGGVTTATGSVLPVTSEPATIPGSPFQVTVSQSATFVEDAGVFDYTAGKWLTRVASAPATGQYSVAAGVYTFAGADTTHNVAINYSYSSTTVGTKSTYTNRVMQPSTGYKVRAYNQYVTPAGVKMNVGVDFLNVHFESIDWTFKAGDWSQQSVKGTAIQDTASQNVWVAYAE